MIKMTVQKKIKDLRTENNLTLEELSKRTGISKSALSYYEDADNCKEISHSSIVTLAKYYDVSTDYLLGMIETRKRLPSAVSDLHLDDEAAALLKSESINTRLLCEIMKHPRFRILMQDMELLVDGHVAVLISALNSFVDATRKIIQEQYAPTEDDTTFRTLKASHIDVFQYFSSQIQEDLEVIIKDIRKQHAGDASSSPDMNIEQMITERYKEVAAFRGSRKEKHAFLVLKQLGINYYALTPEEFLFFTNIVAKSKISKSNTSLRGKHKRSKQ